MKHTSSISTIFVLAMILVSAGAIGCSPASDGEERNTPLTVPAPSAETPNESDGADIDDPAVWLAPGDASKSLIVGAAKFGGMRVYDLSGKELQRTTPPKDADGIPINRYNHVDVQYDFDLNGTRVDLAVATDRIQDKVAIWRIDSTAPEGPLVELTDSAQVRAFPTRPDPNDPTRAVDNSNDGSHTAYGLALWRDKVNDKLYALVNQSDDAVVVQLELIATPEGKISAKGVRRWRFPYNYGGRDLTQSDPVDPLKNWNPQFEGMVVDQQTGILYACQEEVGIWRVDLKTGAAETVPFYETQPFDPASKLARNAGGSRSIMPPRAKDTSSARAKGARSAGRRLTRCRGSTRRSSCSAGMPATPTSAASPSPKTRPPGSMRCNSATQQRC